MTEGWGGTRPEGYESIEKSVTESDNLTGIEVPPAVSGNAKNGLCEIIKKHEATIASLRKQLEDAREALRKILDLQLTPIAEENAAVNNGKTLIMAHSIARNALKGRS